MADDTNAQAPLSLVVLEFRGNGLEFLGWALIAALLSWLIIPAAWGAVLLYRWLVQNVSFSDGTEASFEGRGGEVWGYFAVASILGFVPQISNAIDDPAGRFAASIAIPILLLPFSAGIWLIITRWFFASVKLTCGTPLRFVGRYGPYLGWTFLVVLSVYTIIGWAWATVAMVRWICRNIDAGGDSIRFQGTGADFLWRAIVAALACMFIIPIPWMAVWIMRWFVRNTVLQRA